MRDDTGVSSTVKGDTVVHASERIRSVLASVIWTDTTTLFANMEYIVTFYTGFD